MLANGIGDNDALVVADGAVRKVYAAGAWGLIGRTAPSCRHSDKSANGQWLGGLIKKCHMKKSNTSW